MWSLLLISAWLRVEAMSMTASKAAELMRRVRGRRGEGQAGVGCIHEVLHTEWGFHG